MSLIPNCAEKRSERERESESELRLGRLRLGLGTWGEKLGERRILCCIAIRHP